jgi:hypothetical protein
VVSGGVEQVQVHVPPDPPARPLVDAPRSSAADRAEHATMPLVVRGGLRVGAPPTEHG